MGEFSGMHNLFKIGFLIKMRFRGGINKQGPERMNLK